jgi:cytochrome b561
LRIHARAPFDTGTSSQSYTQVAIALHWVIATVILCNLALGLYMHDLPLSPLKLRLYSYHKWIGITILMLVVLRLAWRLSHRVPSLPPAMPPWQRSAATVSHVMLYVLTLMIPISGWLLSSAAGVKVMYLGVLPIPDLIGKDKALADQLKLTHEWLNYLMLLVIALHVAAALKHHFIDRDDVLMRMLPWVSNRRKSA